MRVMLWLAIAAYSAIGAVVWRLMTEHFAWRFHHVDADRYPLLHHDSSGPAGEQWCGAFCLAFIVGACWPLAAVWALNVPSVGSGGARAAAAAGTADKGTGARSACLSPP